MTNELRDWPDCLVEGCPRKSCRALNSPLCFPHTKGNEHVKRWKIDARNAESKAIRHHLRSLAKEQQP